MNRVVLACNDHPDFQMLLPLTCILWAERTHYKPSVITTQVTDALRFLRDADMIDVHVELVMPNDRLAIKLTRWYSHNYWPNDVLLLQDVDIWPISTEFWNREHRKPVTCHYGDAFQGKRHCTSGFRADAKILRLICPGTWQDRLAELRELPDGDERRHSDDAAQSELIRSWTPFAENSELIERGPSPPKDRIDRSDWPTFAPCDPRMVNSSGVSTILKHVDAHLPLNASDRRVWNQILPLFQVLAPSWAGWARAYFEAWNRS